MPANGTFDFQFILYDAATGGSQVGGSPIVTKNAVAVANGLFSVLLDFGNVFGDNGFFLEVGVRPSGGSAYTTLSPRQALSPTPYALYATTAGQAVIAQSVPWTGVTGKPTSTTQRKITIPGGALSPASGTGITTNSWGPRVASNAPALGFVVPQPADWDQTTPFTVTLMKSQSWVSKFSSTYNTWYFGNPGVGVTVANSFKDNPIWHFAFQRGASVSGGNGESYTGDLVPVAAEISYTAR